MQSRDFTSLEKSATRAQDGRIHLNNPRRASLAGFTLIELLVVIAVIGVLSVITLAFLGESRNKSSDSAVKKALAEARTQAEIFYNANSGRYVGTAGTATDICSPLADGSATENVKGIYAQLENAARAVGLPPSDIQTNRTVAGVSRTVYPPGKATCHACPAGINAGPCGGANSNAWAIEVPLKMGGFWCVDSSGFVGANPDTRLASGDSRCS